MIPNALSYLKRVDFLADGLVPYLVELISVSEVVNKYSNEYLVIRRRVTKDGLILLCRYKTILSVLKVRKKSQSNLMMKKKSGKSSKTASFIDNRILNRTS